MWRHLRALIAAITFLTRVPSPRWVGQDPKDLARATAYFPVVGLVVGLWGGLLFIVAATGWPTWVAAAISTAGTVWITGALHEDALADAFDGFGGGWSKDQILLIMKDSRVGAYGVVGLVLVLIIKLGVLASLAPSEALRALVAAHTLGRWSSLPLIWRYDYVREIAPRSKAFGASVTAPRLAGGSMLALLVVGAALAVTPRRLLLVLLAAVVFTLLSGRYFHRRIGGITGDCLGATNQMIEVATYLALAWQVRG
jgi:adenosylcobinamide-GDP ribazoletransferase